MCHCQQKHHQLILFYVPCLLSMVKGGLLLPINSLGLILSITVNGLSLGSLDQINKRSQWLFFKIIPLDWSCTLIIFFLPPRKDATKAPMGSVVTSPSSWLQDSWKSFCNCGLEPLEIWKYKSIKRINTQKQRYYPTRNNSHVIPKQYPSNSSHAWGNVNYGIWLDSMVWGVLQMRGILK